MDDIKAWLLKNLPTDDEGYFYELLEDIATHGCSGGTVSELIYTEDCLGFYDEFESQIWGIMSQCIEDYGITLGHFLDSLEIGCFEDIKVKLSWFSVEYCAKKLLDERES